MDPREQIKAKIDVVQLIQEYVPLKQTGRNFKALCPFHAEKTPSFIVSPERQIWHCFGCGKGGDIFTFLMEFERMDFIEALRLLAERAGVKLKPLAFNKEDQKKERLLEINHLASEFYHYILVSHKAGENALSYLKRRGVTKKAIETFKLGFAPDRWDLLLNFLARKKGFSPGDIEQAGLIIRSESPRMRDPAAAGKLEVRSENYYDRFRNRIMFTLRNHRGNVVGFAGRTLNEQEREAKYINTPDTPLYHKGEQFFGLDVTKDAIKKENQAILVEGEFDMLASFQAGIGNVVALKGTALTEMQARLIRRFTQNIALAFDVDIAGDAAARRGISIADHEGLNIKVVRLKEGKDPDEVIRKRGVSLWKKAVRQTVSVYDFIIDSALSRFDKKTPEGKRGIAEEVLPIIANIENEIVKAHFVKRVSQELDVSEEATARELDKLTKTKKQKISDKGAILQDQLPTRQEVLEEYLLALLLQKGDASLFEKVQLELSSSFFQNPLFRRIFENLLAFYAKKTPFTIDAFVKVLPNELIKAVDRLYLLNVEGAKLERLLFEIEHVIRELKTLFLKKKMQSISADLKEREKIGDTKVVAALKKEFALLSSELHLLTKKENPLPN